MASKPLDQEAKRRRSARKVIRALSLVKPQLKLDDFRDAVHFYAQESDSTLLEDWSRMFDRQPKTDAKTLKPPGGLTAKVAIGVMIAYVKEDMGKAFTPSKEAKTSFSALCSSLDEQFGAGFAAQVIARINELPGAGFSLHYKR